MFPLRVGVRMYCSMTMRWWILMKEKMKNVANTFLTHRTMGESEAVYKLIPSMNMSKSNIGTLFLNTGKSATRSKRMRLHKTEENKIEREYLEIEGREGEWYEQRDFICQYERRPKLDEMSLAQFARMYRSEAMKKPETGPEGEIDEVKGNKNIFMISVRSRMIIP